jgi:nicotinamidase-related amidase
LSDLGVAHLFIVGAQTDACIRSTLHGAFVRGYDVTLVSDAHTTDGRTAWGAPPADQIIAHTNLYWTYQTAPGRTAGTVKTKDVHFGAL